MAKYKKKHKGIGFISQKLRKYFPSRYPNAASAKERARYLKKLIQDNDADVSLSSIMLIERKKRVRKASLEIPDIFIREELLEINNYFLLSEYPNWIASSSSQVTFVSRLVPEGLPLMIGADYYDYNTYFAPYVNYINKLSAEQVSEEGENNRYNEDWMVMVKPLVPDKKKGKGFFIGKIVSVNSNGEEIDYGFDPKTAEGIEGFAQPEPTVPKMEVVKEQEAERIVTPTESSKAKESEEISKLKLQSQIKESEARIKEAEAKIAEAKVKTAPLLEKFTDMFASGKITKDEYFKLIEKL